MSEWKKETVFEFLLRSIGAPIGSILLTIIVVFTVMKIEILNSSLKNLLVLGIALGFGVFYFMNQGRFFMGRKIYRHFHDEMSYVEVKDNLELTLMKMKMECTP